MKQPQFTERTILTPLWRENARLLAAQHLIPYDDHSLPVACGWNHPRITLALLIALNFTLALAIAAIL
jgi:hypothetical protein